MSRAVAIANMLDRAAILVEQGWTRHRDALDADGVRTRPTSPNACSFCADGALQAAFLVKAGNAGLLAEARRLVCNTLGISPVEIARSALNAWNDGQAPSTGQAAVAQTLREAAQRASDLDIEKDNE